MEETAFQGGRGAQEAEGEAGTTKLSKARFILYTPPHHDVPHIGQAQRDPSGTGEEAGATKEGGRGEATPRRSREEGQRSRGEAQEARGS